MAKMKKTYSYEWYGPCGYEEKEDSNKVSEEFRESNFISSRVHCECQRGIYVFHAIRLESR